MAKKKERDVNLPNIEPEAIAKLSELQRKGSEFSGIVKGKKLLNVRVGSESSVGSNINPDEDADYDFHVHPVEMPSLNAGSDDESKKQFACAVDRTIRSSTMLSPNDAFFAAQYRSMTSLPSLLKSHSFLTRYYLKDDRKYDEFKRKYVKSKNEDRVFREISTVFELIYEEEMDKAYKNQDFSNCADAVMVKNLKERWYAFLTSIGISIEEMDTSSVEK